MKLTRVDTGRLRKAVDQAKKKLDEVLDIIEPELVLLTEAERAVIPRVRLEFPAAGRQLAAASAEHPDVGAAVDYDAKAVIEDLDNVAALDELADKATRVQRMIDDSRL